MASTPSTHIVGTVYGVIVGRFSQVNGKHVNQNEVLSCTGLFPTRARDAKGGQL